MGVYVKGMMMPEDCKECQFENYLFTTGQTWCVAKMEILAIQGRLVSPGYKPKWCPLVEVTMPHGRLIDADKLIIDLMDRGLEGIQTDDYSEIQQTIIVQDTVIEAEGE